EAALDEQLDSPVDVLGSRPIQLMGPDFRKDIHLGELVLQIDGRKQRRRGQRLTMLRGRSAVERQQRSGIEDVTGIAVIGIVVATAVWSLVRVSRIPTL